MDDEQLSSKIPSWIRPSGILKTPEEVLQELTCIRKLVSRYASTGVDREFLTTKIWLEQFDAGPNRVRSRVLDELRSQRRRRRAEQYGAGTTSYHYTADPGLLDFLARRAGLSPSDHNVLYLRFWRDLSISQLSVELHCSTAVASERLRTILRRMFLAGQNDGL